MPADERFVLEVAVQKGILNRDQAKKALEAYSDEVVRCRLGEPPRGIEEILLERGFVTAAEVTELREEVCRRISRELRKAGVRVRRCLRCNIRFLGREAELRRVDPCPVCRTRPDPEPVPESLDHAVHCRYAGALQDLDLQARAALSNNGTIGGRYLKLHRIGARGFGQSWKGLDLDSRRTVKIRIFHGMPPEVLSRRFTENLERLAGLKHRNIARVFGRGREAGRTFVVEEFVEGKPLTALRLSRDEALGVVAQVCDGLQAAHDAGVLHLNLKPSNVIVHPGGGVKVVDFGTLEPRRIIRGGRRETIYGTPPYLAPEQIMGRRDEIDATTDVYLLGALLYYALTRRPPFEGSDSSQLARLVTEGRVKDVRRLNPKVSEDCGRIVNRAMARLKPFRYPRPSTMAKDIRQYLEGMGLRNAYTIMNISREKVKDGGSRPEAERRPRAGIRHLGGIGWLLAAPAVLLLPAGVWVGIAVSRLDGIVSVRVAAPGAETGILGALVLWAIVFLTMQVRASPAARASAAAFVLSGLGAGMLGALAGMLVLANRGRFRPGAAAFGVAAVYGAAGWLVFSALSETGALTVREWTSFTIGCLVVLFGGAALCSRTPKGGGPRPSGLAGARWAVAVGLLKTAALLVFLRGFVREAPDLGPEAGKPGEVAPGTSMGYALRGIPVSRVPVGGGIPEKLKAAGFQFIVVRRGEEPEDSPIPVIARDLKDADPWTWWRSLFLGLINPDLWWVPWAEDSRSILDPPCSIETIRLGPVELDPSAALIRAAALDTVAWAKDPDSIREALDRPPTRRTWLPAGASEGYWLRGWKGAEGFRIGVRLPQEGIVVLLHGGRKVGYGTGRGLIFEVDEGGTYAVRVYTEIGGRPVPWIESGPMFLEPSP